MGFVSDYVKGRKVTTLRRLLLIVGCTTIDVWFSPLHLHQRNTSKSFVMFSGDLQEWPTSQMTSQRYGRTWPKTVCGLDVLKEVGLTLNGKKCELRLPTFFGHVLTTNEVNPSQEKVAAIRDAKPPNDASDVRSFMGLVQYSAKFIPNLASVAQPIQELTKKGARFIWVTKQQSAFEELKRLIIRANTLAYFEVGCRTRIVANASPVRGPRSGHNTTAGERIESSFLRIPYFVWRRT